MSQIELWNVNKTYGKNNCVIDNLNLRIPDGSFTVMVGPSGCGKSTTLRMIAGLESLSSGDLYIDGIRVNDMEPGERDIAMVFQNYALYPTMSVLGNIEFGLINAKVPKEERDRRIREICEIVGLSPYLERRPGELSGGQRQRVALARAMVKQPKVFLMDEPLSNLDAKLRNQMRTELIELHKQLGTTFVYVTHDQTEAMSMATDIVLMNQGEIKQVDSPEKIYNDPDNLFAAQFIGNPTMNLFKREEMDPLLRLPVDIETIGFRPSKVRLLETGDTVSEGELVTSGPILTRELMGSEIIYRIQAPFGVITFKTFNEKQLPEDQTVRAAVMKKSMFFFDKAGRRVRV